MFCQVASPGRLLLKAGSVLLFRPDLLDYRSGTDSLFEDG